MNQVETKNLLKSKLGFTDDAIKKLVIFHDFLLEWNNKYNLISKSTEKDIWNRHILDSAQLIKYIYNFRSASISDLGSGAGLPGLILAIYFENKPFHVKLFEKSPIKRQFLVKISKKLKLKVNIYENVYLENVSSDIIVCRAFKKLEEIIKISREIIKKSHYLIVLKGKNAQAEINNLSLSKNYSYKLKNSMTDKDSKIILFRVKKR